MGPLLFHPFLRPMVWGGRLLGERLGKTLPDGQAYGESWEVSDHRSHASVVASGPLAGQSLRDLMANHRPQLLGSAANKYTVFPWLVKFLDCHDWLSVQVHPNDEQARELSPGEGGKTEAWFILEAQPGSRVYAGLLPGVDEKTLRAALAKGNVADCLHSIEPKAGDCVFLPAGTVHAVGGGVLMAEIQQTSDATFRLFDWNRVDAQGKSRTLHIEQALACIDWKAGPVTPVHAFAFANPEVLRFKDLDIDIGKSAVHQRLASCPFFDMEFKRKTDGFKIGGINRMQLLLPLQGQGGLVKDKNRLPLSVGQVWVLPATMPAFECLPEKSLAILVCNLPESPSMATKTS